MERLWPGPVVYDQALKERAKTFHDPAIQTGVLVEDNTGPIRLNGGGKYVCVYKVGNWIVRCFTETSPPKLAERYQAIISYITHYSQELPFLIHHEWIERGILVQGRYVPFVKVAFIQNSMPLGTFLSDHYTESHITQKIADLWLDMMTRLEKRGIAHGDLDITNVLVCGSYPDFSLKLVDYDGMYVPTMAQHAFALADFGHVHFQPPQEHVQQFGAAMDRFSALVIYLSLIALAQDPMLWENCEANDTDRLLLGAEDYERLGLSRNYQLLYQQNRNTTLRKCLHELENAITHAKTPRTLQEITSGPDTEKPLQPPRARASVVPLARIDTYEPVATNDASTGPATSPTPVSAIAKSRTYASSSSTSTLKPLSSPVPQKRGRNIFWSAIGILALIACSVLVMANINNAISIYAVVALIIIVLLFIIAAARSRTRRKNKSNL